MPLPLPIPLPVPVPVPDAPAIVVFTFSILAHLPPDFECEDSVVLLLPCLFSFFFLFQITPHALPPLPDWSNEKIIFSLVLIFKIKFFLVKYTRWSECFGIQQTKIINLNIKNKFSHPPSFRTPTTAFPIFVFNTQIVLYTQQT